MRPPRLRLDGGLVYAHPRRWHAFRCHALRCCALRSRDPLLSPLVLLPPPLRALLP
uniref:Uncharacterized protein n=1 Tax=Arundo donax TaxID=35708 RepID=A0A0A9FMI1_ARUDO